MSAFVLSPPTPKDGCGKPVHVIGTNGGTLPCGSFLLGFGALKQYFCDTCEKKRQQAVTA